MFLFLVVCMNPPAHLSTQPTVKKVVIVGPSNPESTDQEGDGFATKGASGLGSASIAVILIISWDSELIFGNI